MKLCIIQNCGGRHIARGYCTLHYKRWQIYGEPKANVPRDKRNKRQTNIGLQCKSENCTRKSDRGGMCFAHYQRWLKYKDTLPNIPIRITTGRYKTPDGYIIIPSKGHPNGNKAKSIMEHIKVMSEKIGRPLKKGETVHHKNGIRDDNRPENLELWASRQPGGQRIKDLIIFAKSILAEYGDNQDFYA